MKERVGSQGRSCGILDLDATVEDSLLDLDVLPALLGHENLLDLGR